MHTIEKRRSNTPEDTQAGNGHILPKWIGDEIDGMTQRNQRTNSMVFAKWGAPWFEKWLWRNHEDTHELPAHRKK